MKKNTRLMLLTVALIASVALVWSALGQSKTKPQFAGAGQAGLIPVEFGQKIQLNTASHAVQWRSNSYHLLRLGSIQFELDKDTHRLKAEIQASTTSFDNVDYDISAAVFDVSGALLGTARTNCNIQRIWLGNLLTSQAMQSLDFGASLDYAAAASFMVSISRRNVMTPDQWQK